jgi:hypothetical protein
MNTVCPVGLIIATLDALNRKGSGSSDTSDVESSMNSTFSFRVPPSSITHLRSFIDTAMIYLPEIKKALYSGACSQESL